MSKIMKIAFEEHFMTPGFQEYSKSFLGLIDSDVAQKITQRLSDFDDERLKLMDAHDIELTVLSQTGPGVQGETDTARAIERARYSNDFLADRISAHKGRLGGFAVLPMQDPKAASEELERAVTQLGLKGALVNGHTGGTYYDAPQYDVFWERLQALDVPFYLHPTDAKTQPFSFADHPEMQGATWGWGVETASHALRLLFGGVFDRFPNIKIVLGHMGEGLPYLRWRFDSRFAVYHHGIKLARKPSEYLGSNIVITTSGVCSHPALIGAIGELGEDAVMFSIDYPYESTEEACTFIETAPLDDATRRKVCRDNAARLFKL
ncbi:MAG TPA: amidohydrolase [Rhodospirillaceae bacterium]|nr:amidohydrolase [Rhodospirillaceae bacterium]MAX62319.1 amidohydrolase [Rhodospirillaceae bacterium]MBB56292.1 amidohydrolase [Rhodospirillaceae bacterium]HAE01508.1 amidohydrolase [Rhodospirillaceae bacterium]HBM11773.1 amidohydrolase [Rhodospirillaceae bacterium]|tara:strand:- start:429 stop:1391 length:963 start_codon:yes stop_codon:yes gene_type:complete